MITYNLMDTGTDSLYEHLCKCIKKDIIQGNLMPGERAPLEESVCFQSGSQCDYRGECLCPAGGGGIHLFHAEKRFLYCRCRCIEDERARR